MLASIPNSQINFALAPVKPAGSLSVSHAISCTESIDLISREEVTSGCGEW